MAVDMDAWLVTHAKSFRKCLEIWEQIHLEIMVLNSFGDHGVNEKSKKSVIVIVGW